MVNLNDFCRHFYASRYLPIAYYEHDVPLYSAGFPDQEPLYQTAIPVLIHARQDLATCTLSDTGIYGLIHVDYHTKKRTLKDSGYEYAKIIQSNGTCL